MSRITCCFLALAVLAVPMFAAGTRQMMQSSPFEKAQHQRESLENQPEQQRTRRGYERVLDSYRAIYHGDPASPDAAASISIVADLLAEEGRIFQDQKILHDAIGQYEFLRTQYPGSRYRFNALLAEGEIYRRDLNDRDDAKSAFQEFVKLYPRDQLADQARRQLQNIHLEEAAERRGRRSGIHSGSALAETQTSAPKQAPPLPSYASTKRSRTVLDAAIQSQQAAVEKPAPRKESTPAPVEAAMQQPLPRRTENTGKMPLVTGIRHWSTPVYTRVAIDLQSEVKYEASRVPDPERVFFDLYGTKLSPELMGRSVQVIDGGFLKRIRAAQFSNDVTRIVLDVSDVSEYSAFFLPNPPRLIIDVRGQKPGSRPLAPTSSIAASSRVASVTRPVEKSAPPARSQEAQTAARHAAYSNELSDVSSQGSAPQSGSSLEDIQALSRQPNRVKATLRPTTAPVSSSVAGTTPASQPDAFAADSVPPLRPARHRASKGVSGNLPAASDSGIDVVRPAGPTATGERSLVRTLGLKINRIVIDAGHGGHDSGTLGPGGLEEKDVVLDVALRLGKLLKQRLGADVIYTRDDDTFIPLETRTAIANKAQADLFISVHANSSPDPSARGVETYYLNFTSSPDALEVAARENAVSDESIHQLSDLVKKIALQDKISESREFASDVEQNLYAGLEDGNSGLKDRGVKKAPFVVLIGANMPSILAEISFLTNPDDAEELRQPAYRERIAESLYRGVARYINSLSGVRLAQASSRPPED